MPFERIPRPLVERVRQVFSYTPEEASTAYLAAKSVLHPFWDKATSDV